MCQLFQSDQMENDLSPWDHYKGNKGGTEDSMIHVVELVIMQKKKKYRLFIPKFQKLKFSFFGKC